MEQNEETADKVDEEKDSSMLNESACADGEDSSEEQQKKKKKKKKKKGNRKAATKNEQNADDADDEVTEDDGSTQGGSDGALQLTPEEFQASAALAQIQQAISLINMQQPEKEVDPTQKEFKFWKTQPVPQYNDEDAEEGAIEPDKEDVRQEPLNLPTGFEWSTLDINDPAQLDELYKLLHGNYVEDDDNMFRFDYSREFLKWALQPPEWKKVWHCAVRSTKKKSLLAFISGIPATMRMNKHSQLLVEINFLCVHKKLRSKRLAPVLIQEITRLVNKEGTFQAVYTAGKVLPKPVTTCRYWHRSLHPKKLIDIRFSHLPRNKTISQMVKKYKVPKETSIPGLRPMEEKDVPGVGTLLRNYLQRFSLAPIFEDPDVAHWLLPREGVINAFVVENPETHKITDLISFYTLPSTIVNHAEYKALKAAYSFYNVAGSVSFKALMKAALILAKQRDFDVFNALDLMDNEEFLKDLDFGEGDGHLRYYLYNYRMPQFPSAQNGLVLL